MSSPAATAPGTSAPGCADVWYEYYSPRCGTLHIDTEGSLFSTVASVYSNWPATLLNEVGCDHNSGGGGGSSLNVQVAANHFYYIRIAGFNGATGPFLLNIVDPPIPTNDSCAAATSIGDGSFPIAMCGATPDGPSEPGCGGSLADVWYRYTAPCTGTATVSLDLCNLFSPPWLAVYSGACPAAPGQIIRCGLSQGQCGPTTATFATTAGSQYLIRIGQRPSLGVSGSGTLSVACSSCYPNCDLSTSPPVLNVNDFICFQGRFASGDPYANCDGSTTPPVLNVNDFICFQGRFASGCP